MPTYTVVCFLPDAMIPPATGSPSPMPDSRACAAAATAKGGGVNRQAPLTVGCVQCLHSVWM